MLAATHSECTTLVEEGESFSSHAIGPTGRRGAGRQVAPVLQQVVEAYGCSLVEGVLSHQLKQFVIDGNKCILNKVPPAPPRALHARQQERAGGGRRSSSKQGSWRFSSHRVPRDLGCSHRSRFVQ